MHDLSGFQAKPSIPLDYCHDAQQVVGFANKFDVSSDDLVVSGALTPFKDGDRANEIVNKSERGVLYEASIFFDPYHLTVEGVPRVLGERQSNRAQHMGFMSLEQRFHRSLLMAEAGICRTRVEVVGVVHPCLHLFVDLTP